MFWGQETTFTKDIEVSGKTQHLEGRPDYSLWHGDQRDMETNLVVVATRKKLVPDQRGPGKVGPA